MRKTQISEVKITKAYVPWRSSKGSDLVLVLLTWRLTPTTTKRGIARSHEREQRERVLEGL